MSVLEISETVLSLLFQSFRPKGHERYSCSAYRKRFQFVSTEHFLLSWFLDDTTCGEARD